jgi:hemolysin activation/secretion protein
VGVHANPSFGEYEGTIPAWSLDASRLSLRLARPLRPGPFGTVFRGDAELRATRYDGRDTLLEGSSRSLVRASVVLEAERPFGKGTIAVRTLAGAVAAKGAIPPQALVYLGGPTSAPGYDFHALAGARGLAQRIEWRLPVPGPAIPLGRFGRTPATVTLAPFVNAAWIDGAAAGAPSGWYPSVGLGALAVFDLLRFDVGRGLRDGRWSFSVDLTRDFWRIL